MAIKGFEWVGADKFAHFIVGMMISALSIFMFGLPVSVSMFIVFVAGMLKEYYDLLGSKFGYKPNGSFDKYDVIATVSGGACVAVLIGLIEFIKLF